MNMERHSLLLSNGVGRDIFSHRPPNTNKEITLRPWTSYIFFPIL